MGTQGVSDFTEHTHEGAFPSITRVSRDGCDLRAISRVRRISLGTPLCVIHPHEQNPGPPPMRVVRVPLSTEPWTMNAPGSHAQVLETPIVALERLQNLCTQSGAKVVPIQGQMSNGRTPLEWEGVYEKHHDPMP